MSLSEPEDERVRTIAFPRAFGLGVLVYGAIAGVNLLAVALAAASILAVMARATLTFGQNVAMLRNSRDEALSDPERPLVLALFDLDGFKQYNA